MSGHITIEDPVQIFDVVDLIHDNFFSVDEITFDLKTSTLRIKFRRGVIDPRSIKGNFSLFKKYKLLFFESYLIIHNVKTYEVRDSEKVAEYDFNTIKYDSTNGTVVILTGIPIDIKIKVTKFKLSVELTDNLIQSSV